MPELPEIHRYNRAINGWAQGKVFTSFTILPKFQHIADQLTKLLPFSVRSQVRGKEQVLCFRNEARGEEMEIKFNHGLEGKFLVDQSPNPAPFEKHRFHSNQGDLVYVDKPNMHRISVGSFDLSRGPDPVLDPASFLENLSRLKSTMAAKPIGEVMLEQQFFNGIGNYLRSEILHRAQINPLTAASAVLSDPARRAAVASLCESVCLEVIQTPSLNKYGNAAEKAAFQNWLQCYTKAPELVDSGKRKIYSFFFKAPKSPGPTKTSSLSPVKLSAIKKPAAKQPAPQFQQGGPVNAFAFPQPNLIPQTPLPLSSSLAFPQPKQFYAKYPDTATLRKQHKRPTEPSTSFTHTPVSYTHLRAHET